MALFIPPEVHHTVARFLDDKGLRSMRLVSKMMADIAAEQLFRVIKFHASKDSFCRILEISNHATFSKHVKTIIWDSNLWDLRDIKRFNDFKRFINWKLSRSIRAIPFVHPPMPKVFDNKLYEHYERYQQRVEEEWILLQGFEPLMAPKPDPITTGGLTFDSLSEILPKFTSLKKISMINGNFTCSLGKAIKTDVLCGPTAPGEVISRGESLHLIETGDFGAGVHEFWTSLLAAPKTLTKFRANAVSHLAFGSHYQAISKNYGELIDQSLFGHLSEGSRKFEPPWQHLTSLHLTITTLTGGSSGDHAPQPGTERLFLKRLHALLRSLKKLQSLHLSLERRIHFDGATSATIIIRDGIAPRHTWKDLRKLSLAYLDISPDQLKNLILDHATTLEELRLNDICLDTNLNIFADEEDDDVNSDEDNDPGDWIELMTVLQEQLHLKKARFEGALWSDGELISEPPRWRMDDGLGPALAEYLVHGGEIPLKPSNIWEYSDDEANIDDEDADLDDMDPEGYPWTDEDSDLSGMSEPEPDWHLAFDNEAPSYY